MPDKNQKIQKFISALLIIATITPIVLFSSPKKADAWMGIGDTTFNIVGDFFSGLTSGSSTTTAGTTGASAVSNATMVGMKTKDIAKEIGKEVLMAVARRALQKITQSTVNWINSGFHGSPLFLENPQSFFRDITKYEVRNLIDTFGYDLKRFPFGKDFALNTLSSYKSTLERNAASSLSNVMNQQQQLRYYSINGGGWNGFFLKTQYPQNNYIGSQMIFTDELARRLEGTTQNAAQKITTTLNQGQGFLSPQTCPSNEKYNNGSNEFQRPSFDQATFDKNNPLPDMPECAYDGSCTNGEDVVYENAKDDYLTKLAGAKAKWRLENTCPDGLVNTTPGAVVSSQITKAMGVTQDSTLQAMGVGNSISAIVDALLNHFINKGLNSLATTINPPPVQDNWTYGGQGLENTSTGSGLDSWASGPDEEINIFVLKKQINGADIGICSNIKDTSGVSAPNQEDTSETECRSLSTIAADFGTCSNIKDSNGNPLLDVNDVLKTYCDTLKGTWTKTRTTQKNNTAWEKTGHVPGDIDNTETEIALMDNPPCDPTDIINCGANNPRNPGTSEKPNTKYSLGILQLIKIIPIETRKLDQCLPGPDKGWEERLKGEKDRVESKLNSRVGPDDELAKKAMNDIVRELKFAVEAYQNWVTTKMIDSLPGAIVYMDAIKEINDYPQNIKEVSDSVQSKKQTLARLRAISKNLDEITEQPKPGSIEEKNLIAIKKQYNAIKNSVSSSISIEDTRSSLNILRDKLDRLDNLDPKKGLIAQCAKERNSSQAGWSKFETSINPKTGSIMVINTDEGGGGSGGGGGSSGGGGGAGSSSGDNTYNNSDEIKYFCNIPIKSGYSHGKIIRTYDSANGNGEANTVNASGFTFHNLTNPNGDPGYTDLPLVNVAYIWGELSCTGFCSHTFSIAGYELNFVKPNPDDTRIGVNIDCDTVFNSKELDYTHAGDLTF